MDGYTILQTLHQQGRTHVMLAKHPSKHRGQRVVLKKTDLVGATLETRRLAIQEAQLMTKLKHPNIVKCLETWEVGEAVCIAMEWAELGDLTSLVQPDVTVIMDIVIQLLLALKYLHDLGIIHRDVKTKNILCSRLHPASQSVRVKLADFGVARIMHKGGPGMVRTSIGTPFYSCPEIFSGSAYDFKSDIWSLGCVVYELACGGRPFESAEFADLSHKVRFTGYTPLPKYPKFYAMFLKYFRTLPFGLRDLVDGMLQTSPALRPTAAELLAHPYVQEHCTRLYASLKAPINRKVEYPPAFMDRFGPMRARLGLRGATEAIVMLMEPNMEIPSSNSEEALLEVAFKAWLHGTGQSNLSTTNSLSKTCESSDELTMTLRDIQRCNHDRIGDLRARIARCLTWEEFETIYGVFNAFEGVAEEQLMRYLETRLSPGRHEQLLRDLVYALVQELIRHEHKTKLLYQRVDDARKIQEEVDWAQEVCLETLEEFSMVDFKNFDLDILIYDEIIYLLGCSDIINNES